MNLYTVVHFSLTEPRAQSLVRKLILNTGLSHFL